MAIYMEDSEKLFIEAKNRLDDAKYLYAGKRYNWTVSQSYYTMFYAAKSLIYQKNLSSKKHSGVMKLFSLHYVHEGYFNEAIAKLYFRAERTRLDADYDVIINYDQKQAKRSLENAMSFLEECEKFV
ncbi:HEPN domain-containing protein [Methanobrevibacter curvatus]|uniref:HEPN domain protein n=1 Tax=Methanobrevibacter curvatus TaxID=49547 RepID=A0A165ZRU8_9EURY|nr:HEPN domain-containing protein [Methanobrevibacter curvatus]KZX11081.1 HEPN domain protein [Methanobrevibacter curvatus]